MCGGECRISHQQKPLLSARLSIRNLRKLITQNQDLNGVHEAKWVQNNREVKSIIALFYGGKLPGMDSKSPEWRSVGRQRGNIFLLKCSFYWFAFLGVSR